MTSLGHVAPPTIPGFTHLRLLGAGGYSKVHLYEQHMPHREVAVKVVNVDVDGSQVFRFESEANLMAKVSTHPAIVSVYGAGVSEDGHPYLVMEYCPPPQLSSMLRQGPLSITDALSTAIQIAGAVETAHRAGVVHRDIKPANILSTSYRRPVLSDFGISAMSGPSRSDDELRGMSVPWAPPEQLVGSRTAEPAMDIYSLAATTYAMLTGRSPFEVPGASSNVYGLSRRIIRDPVPPLGRPDAPPSLYRVLSVAMDKNPSARYPSALAFARALQQVEAELGLTMTRLDLLQDPDVADAPSPESEEEDTEATRFGVFSRVDEPKIHLTSPSPEHLTPTEEAEDSNGNRRWITTAVALGVISLVVGGALVYSRDSSDNRPQATFATRAADPANPLGDPVPKPRNVDGSLQDDGTVLFTWETPQEGWSGRYMIRQTRADGSESNLEPVEDMRITVPSQPGSTCLEVYSLREDGRISDPTRSCVSTP